MPELKLVSTMVVASSLFAVFAIAGVASAEEPLYWPGTGLRCTGIEQNSEDNWGCVGYSHAYDCVGIYETHSDVCTGGGATRVDEALRLELPADG